jgi:hypothetical protein
VILINLKVIFFSFFFFAFSIVRAFEFAVLFSERFDDLIVKTAIDKESKRRGLMGVNSLIDYNGILFVYDNPRLVNMWMKKTNIPLDIIFIDSNKKISSIKEGVPNTKKLISSEINVSAVLELPKDCAKKLKIKIGDKINWVFKGLPEIKNIGYYHCLEAKEKIE